MRGKVWVWPGHLLRGALELLAGIPGVGKSQVHCHFAACVTTTRAWPDGTPSGPPANVIMVTAEDCLDDEVIPRLLAAGADLKRVHFIRLIRMDAKTKRQFLLGEDLDVLAKKVEEIGDVALLMIDPITAFMGGKMDSHKATEVRSQLGPLKDFAERTGVAISAITHPAKNASQKARDHFIGSQSFIAAARLGHVCVEETEEEDEGKTGRILFAHAKHNPVKMMPTLAYRVAGIIVGQDPETGEPIEAPYVVWEGVVDITADAAVAKAAGKTKSEAGQKKKAAVQAFLEDMLKDGPVPQSKIAEEADLRGFTEKQIRIAKDELLIVSKKDGAVWVWELPEIPF
jgi:putative DNA primase/helicase